MCKFKERASPSMMAESIIREYESYDYVTGAIPDFIQEGNNITDCMYVFALFALF